MILVVGLGNPGPSYELTRHNAGFMLIDRFIDESDLLNKSFEGELYKKRGVLYLKPSTFMNDSGKSVAAVKSFYKCERVIVAHDDIDLALGMLRFKRGGGHGGHNGLKSIDAFIDKDYERIRIGVGKDKFVAKYVLSEFKEEEKAILEEVLEKASLALDELIKEDDLARVQAKYSLKV